MTRHDYCVACICGLPHWHVNVDGSISLSQFDRFPKSLNITRNARNDTTRISIMLPKHGDDSKRKFYAVNDSGGLRGRKYEYIYTREVTR